VRAIMNDFIADEVLSSMVMPDAEPSPECTVIILQTSVS
jgi:hypothetical protein